MSVYIYEHKFTTLDCESTEDPSKNLSLRNKTHANIILPTQNAKQVKLKIGC